MELVKGCPLDVALEFLARRWLSHIVWTLGRNGEIRFGDLRKKVPDRISPRMLALRLRELEKLGLVSRNDRKTKLPHVTYALTAAGARIDRVLLRLEKDVAEKVLPGNLATLLAN
jgi:DNA-binding HxlR family transcriptional regulator